MVVTITGQDFLSIDKQVPIVTFYTVAPGTDSDSDPTSDIGVMTAVALSNCTRVEGGLFEYWNRDILSCAALTGTWTPSLIFSTRTVSASFRLQNPQPCDSGRSGLTMLQVGTPIMTSVSPSLICYPPAVQQQTINLTLSGENFLSYKKGSDRALYPGLVVSDANNVTIPSAVLSLSDCGSQFAYRDVVLQGCGSALVEVVLVPRDFSEPLNLTFTLLNPPLSCAGSASLPLMVSDSPEMDYLDSGDILAVCGVLQYARTVDILGLGFLQILDRLDEADQGLPLVIPNDLLWTSIHAPLSDCVDTTVAGQPVLVCEVSSPRFAPGILALGPNNISLVNSKPLNCAAINPMVLMGAPTTTINSVSPTSVCSTEEQERSMTLQGTGFLSVPQPNLPGSPPMLPVVTVGENVFAGENVVLSSCTDLGDNFLSCNVIQITLPSGLLNRTATVQVSVSHPK